MCATRTQREVPENFYRPQHGRTLCWYVRLVPPTLLRGRAGVREFRKSTGTADLRRAKAIGAQIIADKRAEWDRLLSEAAAPGAGPRILTADLIEHICARRLYHWMRLDDKARFEGAGFAEEAQTVMSQLCQVTDQSMRSVLGRGRASPEWDSTLGVIDTWCAQIECRVERTDPHYPELVRQFAAVELDAAGRVLQRNRGESSATPPKPAAAGATLSAMSEPYREYKKQNASTKHTGTSANVWLKLIAHVGDVPLAAIKASDLYEFLEARMRAPVKPWSMQHAHGLVKRTLREVFALARTKGLMVASNPVDDLELLPMLTSKEERSRKKPRFPFTDAQLTAIFASDWYRIDTKCVRGKLATDLGARYWVPLICTFHGNRVGEVLQLVASDFEMQNAVPVVQFREEMDGEQSAMLAAGVERSLKNNPTHRVVPLHPTLVELGLPEFVRRRSEADGPNAMLFPSSLPNAGGKAPMLGRAYEQAFLRYVRDALAFGRGFGNHSYRHQLEDRIRDAQLPGHRWPAGLAQAYTGRKRLRDADRGLIETEGSEAAYGRGHGPTSLLQYIRTLRFDIGLPPPFETWLNGARA